MWRVISVACPATWRAAAVNPAACHTECAGFTTGSPPVAGLALLLQKVYVFR